MWAAYRSIQATIWSEVIFDIDGRRKTSRLAAIRKNLEASTTVLNTPSKSRRQNRRVPKLGHLIVQFQNGNRSTGHLETRNVRSDETPGHLDSGFCENLVRLPVDNEEFDQRRATHPIYEQQDLVTRLEG